MTQTCSIACSQPRRREGLEGFCWASPVKTGAQAFAQLAQGNLLTTAKLRMHCVESLDFDVRRGAVSMGRRGGSCKLTLLAASGQCGRGSLSEDTAPTVEEGAGNVQKLLRLVRGLPIQNCPSLRARAADQPLTID